MSGLNWADAAIDLQATAEYLKKLGMVKLDVLAFVWEEH